LLKPIPYDRFLKAAWKARDYFALREQPTNNIPYLFVKSNGRLEKIIFSDILFIEGMENYVAIYLENKKIITHSTIKSLIEKLPSKQFIQSHKSYVVAIDKISSIEGNMLHVQSYKVPVSKYLREEVLGQIVR
jgi:DNA-binding LytR/AlgR family response regulator